MNDTTHKLTKAEIIFVTPDRFAVGAPLKSTRDSGSGLGKDDFFVFFISWSWMSLGNLTVVEEPVRATRFSIF
jgi:hypothetical protein